MTYLKKYFNTLETLSDKYWTYLYLGFSCYFVFTFTIHIFQINHNWSDFHLNIFIFSFLCFFLIILGFQPKPFLFLGVVFVIKIFPLDDWIEIISDWIFFKSPFFHLFDKIGAKDSNVFLIFIFIFLGLVCFFKLTYCLIKQIKLSLSIIFSTLTIFSFVFITLLFHYVLIEKYLTQLNNNEMKHMETVFTISEPNLFNKSCQINDYICSFNGGLKDIEPQFENSKFSKHIQHFTSLDSNVLIKGNFPVDISQYQIYLVLSSHNKWVINTKTAGLNFKFSEQWLMFSLSCAHGFWLLFYIWLLLFHRKKKLK